MKRIFYAPDLTDERIAYAAEYLENNGYMRVKSADSADFILLGVNPDRALLRSDKLTFAGNVKAENVIDYTKNEAFAVSNAYLTAEGALAVAINESKTSLINSPVLIIGYGRIGKALRRYIAPFTNDITVCARRYEARSLITAQGAKAIGFESLTKRNGYAYIINTVPHPVLGDKELNAVNKDALIIDLASFPGGVDKKYAKHYGIRLITAGGLPSRCSPKSAGVIVGKTVINMLEEVFL